MNQFTVSTLPGPPISVDESTRSCELVVATSAAIGGISLRVAPDAIQFGPAPVPVLMDHQNATAAMCGRITAIRTAGDQVIGTAVFADAPAADAGWALAQAGCAVSVGALVQPDDLAPLDATADRAARWTLREVSLVPVGADPACVVRSQSLPPNTTNMAQSIATDSAPEIISRAEITRERNILRSAQAAGLNAAETQALVDGGQPYESVVMEILRRLADRTPAKTTGAITPLHTADDTAEKIVQRALEGKLTGLPLWQQLQAHGYGKGARSPVDVMRAGLSTSDLPNLLQLAGDRVLLARFSEFKGGVMAAASVRQLTDYRSATSIDVGLVGAAQKMGEGQELELAYINDSAVTYKPSRWARGLKVSPESMVNDDLQGLQQAISELALSCLDAEKSALVDLLQGSTNGATCADGAALFATAHANNAAGGLTIAGLSAAIQALRSQTTVGGRYVDLQPGTLLVPVAAETSALQLVSTNLAPALAANVQPWSNLKVEVDPRLSGSYAYVIAAGSRLPLELGRISQGPSLATQQDFASGYWLAKAEHSFGCTVSEYRSVVRLALS